MRLCAVQVKLQALKRYRQMHEAKTTMRIRMVIIFFLETEKLL